MDRSIAFAAALSLCALAQQGCAPDGKPLGKEIAPTRAQQAYAAPQREEDACGSKTYAGVMAGTRGRSLFLWDYKIDVRQGDTLWGIARETRDDPLAWKMLERENKEAGVFGARFDPAKDLRPGSHILVYLPPGMADCYAKERPGRNMTYWSHGPGGEPGYRDSCGCGPAKK